VLGARMGGIPEFIREGVTGRLFNPRAPGELTAILSDLMSQPAQVEAMAVVRPPVKLMETDAQAWEERYREVMAHRNPAGPAEHQS
jgi:hypothetical protein